MTLALQNYVDKQGPAVSAAWLNETDQKRFQLSQPQAPGGATTSFILGVQNVKYKTAQTARTTTVVLADDPDLIFTSVAAGTYLLKAFLQFQNPGGGAGLSWKINVAGTLSGNNFSNYHGIYNGAVTGDVLAASGVTTTQNVGTISTAVLTDFISMEGVFTTTTTGNVSVQWCQRTSSANSTIIQDRSWLSLVQVA